MKIEFETHEYVINHGANPRGRGSWAFATNPDAVGADIFWTPGATTFGEAKRMARAHFARRHQTARPITITVWVLP